MNTKLQLKYSDPNLKEGTTNISYANPNAADGVLKEAAQKLNSLTNNTLNEVHRVDDTDITNAESIVQPYIGIAGMTPYKNLAAVPATVYTKFTDWGIGFPFKFSDDTYNHVPVYVLYVPIFQDVSRENAYVTFNITKPADYNGTIDVSGYVISGSNGSNIQAGSTAGEYKYYYYDFVAEGQLQICDIWAYADDNYENCYFILLAISQIG